jgi:tRNA pseudouridine55 synthase
LERQQNWQRTLQAEKKAYIAKIILGATTPSFDKEHAIDKYYPHEQITLEQVNQAIAALEGEQDQIPPSFSAKFVDGVRAYDIARGGDDIVLKPSKVTIYSAKLLSASGLEGDKCTTPENLPELSVDISCSKGTYIRSIARDLGTALGSGGYLSGLIRRASGGYILDNAISMEQFEQIVHIAQ